MFRYSVITVRDESISGSHISGRTRLCANLEDAKKAMFDIAMMLLCNALVDPSNGDECSVNFLPEDGLPSAVVQWSNTTVLVAVKEVEQ